MGATSASPLAASTGYRLIKLGELAMARAEEALEEFGIHARHFNVLGTVAAHPTLSQREVSSLLGLDPNVMVGVIDELERSGLAARQRSTVDRRRHVIVVSEDGHLLLRRGAQALAASEEDFLASLGATDRERFHAYCGTLLGLDQVSTPEDSEV